MIPSIVLFGLWPVVVLGLFLRCTVPVALSVTVIGGYLLLPTQTSFNLPAFPSLNKDTVPILVAALCLLVGLRRRGSTATGPDRTGNAGESLGGLLPGTVIGRVLLGLLVVGPVMTVLTNGDRLTYGATVLPGLGPYDGAALLLTIGVTVLPMLLARKYLYRTDHHRILLAVLAVAGLLYTLPALYEIRFSPQLNRMVYGFFPHSWAQHVRAGGFRPLVFLHHGLWLGAFFAGALIALCGWMRTRPEGGRRGIFLLAILWLSATLVLSKTVGALAIAVALLPVVLFLPLRAQLLTAALIAATVLTYPLLRQADLVPMDAVVDVVRPYSNDRAASLQYRLNNEALLLERASERMLFGWGPWNRFRVFNEETGRDESTPDGRWIIVMGQGGLVRYLAVFGLFGVPLILLFLRHRQLGVTTETAALALVMAANLTDMIPNATETPVTWLVAGALLGRLESRVPLVQGAASAAAASGPDPAQGPVPVSAYTRQTVRHVRQNTNKT